MFSLLVRPHLGGGGGTPVPVSFPGPRSFPGGGGTPVIGLGARTEVPPPPTLGTGYAVGGTPCAVFHGRTFLSYFLKSHECFSKKQLVKLLSQCNSRKDVFHAC